MVAPCFAVVESSGTLRCRGGEILWCPVVPLVESIMEGGVALEDWQTINDLAARVSLAESTARRYASLFGEYLPAREFGRVKKYAPECGQILARIAELYQEGLGTPEVIVRLQGELPRTVDADGGQGGVVVAPGGAHAELLQRLGHALLQQEEEIRTLRQELAELRQEVQHTAGRDQVKQLQNTVDLMAIEAAKRDLTVVSQMRLLLEERQRDCRPWWKRLLGIN